ncbi:MAG: hypothetical protein A3J72_04680, partial [Nitrospirae bacterium RIFCSPHIGHO2_02_FULL_40_19]
MGKEIFNEDQVRFLETVKSSEDITRSFYLTGGTALAAFYLNHRESEDLDFFSEKEVEPLAIETFLKSNKTKLGFEKIEFQRSFNRNLFFLHFKNSLLKTEFTYFPFTPLEKGGLQGKLKIDSLKDIAVNKVFAISQQSRARDFVDLYCIVEKKGWSLKDLLKDARIKFDVHIDLIQFGAQLIKIQGLADLPKMLIPLDFKAV